MLKPQSSVSSTDEQEPFMGVKMRRRSSMYRLYKGYYLDDASKDCIQKLLTKHGVGGNGARRARFQELQQTERQREEDEHPGMLKPQSSVSSTDEQEPFMGVKMRRRSSMYRLYKGYYLDDASKDCIQKLLTKHGDREVLFAEKLVKVTRRRRLVRRILLITDVALYLIETQFYNLKRRIPITSIAKVALSEQSDNFFAIIIPSEYDTLLASTRKSEIVTVLVEASKKALASETEDAVEVEFANKFEYYLDSEHIREVITEQVEGGVKTIFVDK